MDIGYELERLKQRAAQDKALKQELLDTKNSSDPIKAFCDKCVELGYEHITVYELMTAGEAFCDAMLRSVNGGGVEAPEAWDDFYGMFFEELEHLK